MCLFYTFVSSVTGTQLQQKHAFSVYRIASKKDSTEGCGTFYGISVRFPWRVRQPSMEKISGFHGEIFVLPACFRLYTLLFLYNTATFPLSMHTESEKQLFDQSRKRPLILLFDHTYTIRIIKRHSLKLHRSAHIPCQIDLLRVRILPRTFISVQPAVDCVGVFLFSSDSLCL